MLSLVREKLFDGGQPLTDSTDLFAAGLDSMGIMQLLILIEQSFGVRIPDQAVTQDNFRSPVRIAKLIRGFNAGAR